MADAIAPLKTVTFTVSKLPSGVGHLRTIERLMRMQPHLQKELKRRAMRRRQTDNRQTRRGGRIWIDRARAVKLAHCEAGQTFTLFLTPQIIPDVRSVERFLTIER
jgi:hypothetical protein